MNTSERRKILSVNKLCKKFNGFSAVSNIDLSIYEGDIHVLIGPNGAGKTTFFNLLTKFLAPTSGSIFYFDEDITKLKPEIIARKGIIRSFQISAIFPSLTVLENVRIALQRSNNYAFNFWSKGNALNKLNDKCLSLLEDVGLQEYAYSQSSDLPYGRKRALELATTLAANPKVMLLDEPTQGLGHEDVDLIINLIKKVSIGRTILVVEHNMKVVSNIADRITVFSRGRSIADGTYDVVSKDPQVIESYLGRAVNNEVGAVS